MRNRKNNNDILKDYIKSFSGYAKTLGITGRDLGSASRSKLEGWVMELGGVSPEHVISNYRAKEYSDITPEGNKERKEFIEKEKRGEVFKEGEFTDSAKIGQAIIDAMGGVGAKDAELRQDVTKIAEEVLTQGETIHNMLNTIEKLGKDRISNLHIKIGDKPEVDAGKVHMCFDKLLQTASCRLHAFLTGGAGSFKTSSAEKVAEVLGLECSSISVSAQTTETKLLGYMNAKGEYVTTEFRKRYENGGVFILDEIDNGNANTLAVLNSALANGNCAFADGMVAKHEDFILIATANTFGSGASAQYVGRNKLDDATLDRFVFIEWDYDNKLEMHIAPNKEWCADVQAIRKAVEDLKIKAVVSPRATFDGAKLLQAGMGWEDVLFAKVWKGMAEDAQEKVLAKVASNGHTLGKIESK